jgi:amino acid transporter
VGSDIYSIYTIGPLDTVLASSATGYPIIDLFFAATNNLHGTNFMVAVVIINLAASVIAALAAASRQLWAFARNNGIPFPGFFAPVRAPFLALPSFTYQLTWTVSSSI